MTRKPFYFIMLGGLVLFIGLVLIAGYNEPEQAGEEPGGAEPVEFDAAGAYASSCASCHGVELEGSFGPGLVGLTLSADEIVDIINNGKKGEKEMPAGVFQGTDEEKQALAEWILTHQ